MRPSVPLSLLAALPFDFMAWREWRREVRWWTVVESISDSSDSDSVGWERSASVAFLKSSMACSMIAVACSCSVKRIDDVVVFCIVLVDGNRDVTLRYVSCIRSSSDGMMKRGKGEVFLSVSVLFLNLNVPN